MSSVAPVAMGIAVTAAARDAIARLMMQYVHAIDNDELERWPHFFTEHCVYQILTRADFDLKRPIGVWYCDNRAMLEDRVSAMREVNVFEPHVYRHVIGPTEILGSLDGGRGQAYRAQTSYIVVRTMQDGEMSVFSAGRYLDEIVFADDAPLFSKRVVVTDSARYDTLVVIPL